MKFAPGLAVVLLLNMPLAAMAAGTMLDGTQVLPDPSLVNGARLPASAATSGVAVVSAAQDGPLQNCSRHNPCALPTPARDHINVVKTVTPNKTPVQYAKVSKNRHA